MLNNKDFQNRSKRFPKRVKKIFKTGQKDFQNGSKRFPKFKKKIFEKKTSKIETKRTTPSNSKRSAIQVLAIQHSKIQKLL